MRLRLLGAELHDIRQYASEQTPPWDVSDRQLWRYIAAGDVLLDQSLEKDRVKLMNRQIAQRRVLYARAVAVSDYRVALAILKDEAALLHLYDNPPGKPVPDDGSRMNTGDVVQLLAVRLRQVDRSELSTVEKSRLTASLADALLRAISVDEIEKRLEALEAVLDGRKERER